MKDFVYNGTVRIVYGAGQMENVVKEISSHGKKAMIVPAHSFVAGGKLAPLKAAMETAGIESICLENINGPMLSKVNEGIAICLKENIEVVIGIGGGVCMDLAKAIAFGAKNTEVPLEKYLTYECSAEGLEALPVITIPTNPMSGSETNADVQITFDETGLQAGCMVGAPVVAWLNPEYAMSLPDKILMAGQMTEFVQISMNYLNLTRSPLAESYAEGAMKTLINCLRTSISDHENRDARGTLLLISALSLSGINDLGRDFEFVPYPLQSFAQRYLGLNYTQALTGLFPYWLKEIYRASSDKAIFYRYFEEILHVKREDKADEELLQEALRALKAIYQEFGTAFTYGELAEDPKDHKKLVEIIDSFGPMTCSFMPVPTEKLAQIIEDAIAGNLQ